MSVRAWLLAIVAIAVPLATSAQVDEALEQMVGENDNEELAAAMADMLTELGDSRPNLNDTATLSSIPLLSPFQQKALRNYIVLHGPLLSHKELAMIPGFDSTDIALLESTTSTAPMPQQRSWRLKEGRHTLTLGLGSTLEQAAGYSDGSYEGDALHARMVYTYNLHNHISLALAADKDPTEPWGKGNFVGYSLQVNDFGRLERLIAGRYNLKFGQGLTLWTGLQPFDLLGASPERYGQGVTKASTFYETGYQEGLAGTMRVGNDWHISAFLSKSGGAALAGGHVEYRHGNLVAGLTAAGTLLDDSIAPTDRIYNEDYFRGKSQTNVGLDAVWQWRRLTLYGEAAVGDNLAAAAIAGAKLSVDTYNSLAISYRNYAKDYHNLGAQPYAIGEGRNESGWRLDARTRLPLRIDALVSADIHKFPTLRYGSYRPSSGASLRTQLSRQLTRATNASVRYTYRLKERNIPYSSTTTYEYEETCRHQILAALHHGSGAWSLDTKVATALFESGTGTMQHGWVAMQQLRYSRRALQATASAAYFDVDGYYARIYLYESQLRYNFAMPSYYGRGMRACAVVRYNIGRGLTLEGKYTITHYLDRESVGSGAAATEGPNRQTLYLQIHLNL